MKIQDYVYVEKELEQVLNRAQVVARMEEGNLLILGEEDKIWNVYLAAKYTTEPFWNLERAFINSIREWQDYGILFINANEDLSEFMYSLEDGKSSEELLETALKNKYGDYLISKDNVNTHLKEAALIEFFSEELEC